MRSEAEAETGRIFYSPPRPAPSLVFILRPRPASSRKKLSPPRPAPLFQAISINGIDTKGRNEEDFLLPASPRPVSSFYFSSPPRFGLCSEGARGSDGGEGGSSSGISIALTGYIFLRD
jgi:hypothetical protein